jgi:hypothetical protein
MPSHRANASPEMSNAHAYIDEIRRDIEESSRTRLGKDSVNMLNTVSESIFSRSAHFILELLQNAEDAGPKNGPPRGEIEFAISETRIRITHNGTPFTSANVDAICGVRSTKKPEQGTLGFLGIGFKSVFKVTDCPQVHSGDFHFKFDKSAHGHPSSVPWQIMPLAVDVPSEPVDPALTTFILPFRSPEFSEQTRGELEKLDVHVFLFLRWLKRLRIGDEVNGESTVITNEGETDGILSVKKNDAVQNFAIFRRSVKVPPEVANDPVLSFYKRQAVAMREVVIAFAIDQNGDLKPIEDASALGSVSSFLPLVEERSGAKFLIQADFLVQPGREAIQYELGWNRWLVAEAVETAKDAIEGFKAHAKWRNQFLPLFDFRSYDGQPAFDRLFGPHLKAPLLDYLRSGNVVAAKSGDHVQPKVIVYVEDGLRGLLTDADLPLLFPGRNDLRFIADSVDVQSLPSALLEDMRRVDLGQVARNRAVLGCRVGQPDWFEKFYRAMAETRRLFKDTQRQGRRGRIEWVEDPIFVFAETNKIESAKGVHLRNIPKDVLDLRTKHPEVDAVLRTYKLLHPRLESDDLNLFFVERTHVEAIDYDKICRSVFLPKMRTDAPKPRQDELMAYTRLLQKGPRVTDPIWVLTKSGAIKPSNEVFMGSAYSPAENWEANARYAPQIDFLSPSYLQGVPPGELPAWKGFFTTAGLKESGERNHVEMFAMAFVEDRLSNELKDFVPKNRQQVGYDREAKRKTDDALASKSRALRRKGRCSSSAMSRRQRRQPFRTGNCSGFAWWLEYRRRRSSGSWTTH